MAGMSYVFGEDGICRMLYIGLGAKQELVV